MYNIYSRRLISNSSRNMIESKRYASLSEAKKFRRRFIRRTRFPIHDRTNAYGDPREKGTARIFISIIRRVNAPRDRARSFPRTHRRTTFVEPTKSNGGVINIKNIGDGKPVRSAG